MVNWESNVFPGVLGRTCDRPCEPACRRGRVDEEPVAICRLKRVAADNKGDIKHLLPKIPKKGNGKRIALIGAGPASLTVARDLAPLGYEIHVFDEQIKGGGMMRSQIPSFRLPETVLDEEVNNILDLGIHQHFKTYVSSLKEVLDNNYDAVFCTGGYQEQEIRLAEKLYNKKQKEIIRYGYPLLDEIKNKSGAANKKPVLLIAPSGYEYQKPSGSRSPIFIKPDLALNSSATVAFVALAMFRKLCVEYRSNLEDLRTVFVDTMAIAPVVYALRDLLLLVSPKKPIHIESFHSYGGFDEVQRPLAGTSLCVISASSSMRLHENWVLEKAVSPKEVITLLTLSSAKKHSQYALLKLEAPSQTVSQGPVQQSIRIKGEHFLPEQESPRQVLLNNDDHRSDN